MTMATAEKLQQLIQSLPEAQIQEVLHFAEFLQQKHLRASPPRVLPPGTLTGLLGVARWSGAASSDEDLKAEYTDQQAIAERAAAIRQMRGLLKTDQPAPTDQEVAAMLEARRTEKYPK